MPSVSPGRALRCATIAVLVLACVQILRALDPLPQDRGAAGTWQKLLKLGTIASVMHTTAHPDDEHGGMLALLSRGEGARVSLLTLTRGEAGDNAIGAELFDALGLIRTEELLRADQYYGVDQQYFTTVIDYGFSKRLEEALVKWGREHVLRDVVRIIRMERPLVLVARFQGNERDGHGNHQTAGLITQDAFKVAGDPSVFPEQIRDGLRPWQPLKLYMGGMRENEDWTVRVDTGVYSPWLGESYANFARIGLGFQRSQNGGRVDLQPGPASIYYKRLLAPSGSPAKESSLFDGIDTRISSLFGTLKHQSPPNAPALLGAIEREVDAARSAFTMQDPSASVPALARGLSATRLAIDQLGTDQDAVHVLRIKEQQFIDAINTALGIEFTAVAQPSEAPERPGPAVAFAPPPTMEPFVPGQAAQARVEFTNNGAVTADDVRYAIRHAGSDGIDGGMVPSSVARGQTQRLLMPLIAPRDAPPTGQYFRQRSINDSRYDIVDPRPLYRPASPPAFTATAFYRIGGVPVRIDVPVTRREAQLPYGYVMRELAIVPALAVNVTPRQAIVPLSAAAGSVRVQVEVVNHAPTRTTGELTLKLPAGWTSQPASIPFAFERPGETSRYELTVSVPSIAARDYTIDAIATSADGRTFAQGIDVLAHRDLETRYLYRAASVGVRGVDVKIVPGLRVGYVMGVGDEVPSGIAQLGASVRLLDARDLSAGDLRQFDAIVTGTRAYAVRDDLKTYNRRLLDYVRDGGNLIVLYNTPAEFDPMKYAPFPAQLPRTAEEVSEEDSPVTLLAPTRPELTTPNAIARADFDGWVEQRGSKFFSEWDAAYTPIVETHDQGQPPQRGGWLTATYGKGHYTYFAYAFHRQLPFGVPGAYRLLANLLSLGRTPSIAHP